MSRIFPSLLSTLIAPLLIAMLTSVSVSADESLLSGKRQISLVDKKGNSHLIGDISFTAQGDGIVAYKLHLDHNRFTDHFLSMKEMKCLEGPELWCRIPYPYANPHQVKTDDLRWLEHDLLFLFKRNGEFGANFWNGIYYQLKLTDQGIEGEGRAIDLNFLASPPDDLQTPPIGDVELDDLDTEKRWLPRLLIK
ncbi:MAG: hypothetical protein OQK12_02775 [Motiliproteus sp.]|nr:hypothetical protein [Motiliproteus sp.]MCW9052923.1 hypothetical protein [Motiliproteus sp.]